ncbi:MAG: ferritin family protein, partial [Eubacteriales bacterium]
MDILDSAIKMELEGEKYYLKLAEENKSNSLYEVFIALAKDEANHAAVIRAKQAGKEAEPSTKESATMASVFGQGANFQFAGKKPAQLDVYREAQEKEKESIALYKKMADELKDTGEMSAFLIAQEEEHYLILDEIVKAVTRPEEWVESAEFGLREEY